MSVVFGSFTGTRTMSPAYLLKSRARSAGVTRSVSDYIQPFPLGRIPKASPSCLFSLCAFVLPTVLTRPWAECGETWMSEELTAPWFLNLESMMLSLLYTPPNLCPHLWNGHRKAWIQILSLHPTSCVTLSELFTLCLSSCDWWSNFPVQWQSYGMNVW